MAYCRSAQKTKLLQWQLRGAWQCCLAPRYRRRSIDPGDRPGGGRKPLTKRADTVPRAPTPPCESHRLVSPGAAYKHLPWVQNCFVSSPGFAQAPTPSNYAHQVNRNLAHATCSNSRGSPVSRDQLFIPRQGHPTHSYPPPTPPHRLARN